MRKVEWERMNIKCIALDLDRTTLNTEGRLSEMNRAAIEQAISKGIHIIIASGRSFDALPEEIKNFSGLEYAVTGNGAAMYHIPTRRCLFKHILSEKDVLAIIKETKDKSVTYEAFIDGIAYCGKEYLENPEAYGATPEALEYVIATRHLVDDIVSFIKSNRACLDSMDIIIGEEEKIMEMWERVVRCTSEVYITSSMRQLVEISHKNAGKHTGVEFFIKLLNLRRDETAAFGDAGNDIDMLTHVGCGIAVENASEECKAAADYITRHHNEDGVAYGMREILHVID